MKVYAVFFCSPEGDGWAVFDLEKLFTTEKAAREHAGVTLLPFTKRDEVPTCYFDGGGVKGHIVEEIEVNL